MSSDRMGADLAKVSALAGTGSAGPVRASALKKVSQDFEAVFVRQLMDIMRKTVPKSGLFQQGLANDIYTGMLDTQLASSAAQGGGLGLAGMVFESLAQNVRNQGGEIINDVEPDRRAAVAGYAQQPEAPSTRVDRRG